MIYSELSTNAQIVYARVEKGGCDIVKLTLAKTKNVITVVEFDFIKTVFSL